MMAEQMRHCSARERYNSTTTEKDSRRKVQQHYNRDRQQEKGATALQQRQTAGKRCNRTTTEIDSREGATALQQRYTAGKVQQRYNRDTGSYHEKIQEPYNRDRQQDNGTRTPQT